MSRLPATLLPHSRPPPPPSPCAASRRRTAAESPPLPGRAPPLPPAAGAVPPAAGVLTASPGGPRGVAGLRPRRPGGRIDSHRVGFDTKHVDINRIEVCGALSLAPTQVLRR